MYHTQLGTTTLTPSQIAMQQMSQYDRVGHGHLVPMKSAQTPPPQTTSTAMVLAGHHQANAQSLVPAAPPPPPPPPPPQAPTLPPPVVVSATPPSTVQPPAQSVSPAPPPSEASAVNTIKTAPSQTPLSNTILIHIPLIPTPFRIAIDPAQPYALREKINALLVNPNIQERIQSALSVPKRDGWILVERVNTEFLQLRDLLAAVGTGRLMTEGVIPWVCAGELVEGGVGYWCLGVCT